MNPAPALPRRKPKSGRRAPVLSAFATLALLLPTGVWAASADGANVGKAPAKAPAKVTANAPPKASATPATQTAQAAPTDAARAMSAVPTLLDDPNGFNHNLAAHEAAMAAHDAADAARSAAEAAKATAQAVHEIAGHVDAIEHPEPSTKPELPAWAYRFGINALMKTGNASQFSGSSNLGIDGNWHNWALELRARGAYGSTSPVLSPSGDVTTANGSLSARGEYNYTPFLGNYLLLSLFTDRMASIKYQIYAEPGINLMWWEIERDGYIKSRLRTSLGLRLMRESRKQFYPTPLALEVYYLYGPSLSVSYRYALSRGVYITEDFDITYNVPNSHDIRVNSQTALNVSLTGHVALQVGAIARHIGHPAPGRKATDFEMNVGLTFDF